MRDEGLLLAALAFYRSRATVWMWIAAVSLVVFTFALNTLVDNVDGHYAINHPLVFVFVQIAMLLVLAVSFHISHEPRARELRAVLTDLESQLLERTDAVDREQDRWRAQRQNPPILALTWFGHHSRITWSSAVAEPAGLRTEKPWLHPSGDETSMRTALGTPAAARAWS